MQSQFPLHEAAQHGDTEAVRRILSGLDDLPVNEPDDAGRSAIFYSQIHGFDDITDLLAARGWSKMPEGSIFRGPGGRQCFWTYDEPSFVSRPQPRPHPRFVVAPTPSPAAKLSAKKAAIRERKVLRSAYYRGPGVNVVGPAHKMYPRKQPGRLAPGGAPRPPKPALNTRDLAALHWRPGAMRNVLCAAESARASDLCWLEDMAEAEIALGEGDVPHAMEHAQSEAMLLEALTLADAARFVLDRRPTRNADGAWVVVEPEAAAAKTQEEAAVVAPTPLGGARSLASLAANAADDGGEWPALDGGVGNEEAEWSEVDEEEWEVLSDDGEDASVASPLATKPLAWCGGAAATRAAVGFGVGEEGGVAMFARAPSPPTPTGGASGVAEFEKEEGVQVEGAESCLAAVPARAATAIPSSLFTRAMAPARECAEACREEAMAHIDEEACLKSAAHPRGRAGASHRRR